MTTLATGTQSIVVGPGGQAITVTNVGSAGGIPTITIPVSATSGNPQWIPGSGGRLKVEPGLASSTANLIQTGVMNNITVGNTATIVGSSVVGSTNQQAVSLDCYEDMFKEITKKLYGTEDGLALMTDASDTGTAGSIIYDTDAFRTDPSGAITFVNANGLPPGTIVIQRRVQDEKRVQPAEQLALGTVQNVIEERWFESENLLNWTTSKIARYNPAQKVFRCVDCDFVGFLSRIAEHWLGNHASLRVFQCPRCPYTSAWARCVRMHLTRQHGEVLNDNNLWKENPALEEVTKFLHSLKSKVEQKIDTSSPGEKRYFCQYCSYTTDRRDLFNRHENIHRDEKPFQCFVCDKQFNRADHVKKHFTRMHREHTYDINKIRKYVPRSGGAGGSGSGVSVYQSKYKQETQTQHQQAQIVQIHDQTTGLTNNAVIQLQSISGGTEGVTVEQMPQLVYFNTTVPPVAAQGISTTTQGVGGDKKAHKSTPKAKGQKKKKVAEKMFTCSYCPWQGVDNWCLKRHLNTHIKPFLCALCDYKAARSERLATHVLKVHNKRVCHKCPFLADDPESLALHVQDSHQNPLVKTGFNCNICQEYFELRADLEAHAILEHQKVIVQCDLCDYRTTDELSMETHLREKHNLQPGMGAVAAATAAAAAAVSGQQQQQIMVSNPPQLIQFPVAQLPIPTPPATVQIPPPPLHPITMSRVIKQEQLHHIHQQPQVQLITGDIQAYHIDEAISSVVGDFPPEEEEKTLDLSCDFCGCEFHDEESVSKHQKGHELRKPEPQEIRNSKSISRYHTCSTCSYNSATSRIMMQHQMVHSGFELECKAEGCFFTSPYKNSLQEHIHSEHNDGVLRCPHCGYRIPSLIDFGFHWQTHHHSVCNLCVGMYRSKYGLKEPDIQDLLFRTPYEMLEYRKPEGENESEESTIHISRYPEGEPMAKHCQDELGSVFSSVTTYLNNPSIQFLPRTTDIEVTILKPKIDTVSTPRPRRKLWDLKFDRRNTREKVLRYTVRRLISTKKDYSIPLLLTRRGFGLKCFQHECRFQHPSRFNRKITFLFHQARVHQQRHRIRCDQCDTWFPYLYKALLHYRRYHPSQNSSNPRQQLSTKTVVQHNHELMLNNNNLPTRLTFKHE